MRQPLHIVLALGVFAAVCVYALLARDARADVVTAKDVVAITKAEKATVDTAIELKMTKALDEDIGASSTRMAATENEKKSSDSANDDSVLVVANITGDARAAPTAKKLASSSDSTAARTIEAIGIGGVNDKTLTAGAVAYALL
ncbi:MAG: hypothetical protein ISS36_00570 [Candidatus Aenigmarchaeota archaeon]|nr:hypothetical protein [Candidatus Aenigmarchaeota archaeon]